MEVTLSRARRGLPAFLLVCVAWILSWCGGGAAPRSSWAQEEMQSLGSQLFAEAKAAKTLDQQNAVLEKIEKIREQDGTEALHEYLNGLSAWLVH